MRSVPPQDEDARRAERLAVRSTLRALAPFATAWPLTAAPVAAVAWRHADPGRLTGWAVATAAAGLLTAASALIGARRSTAERTSDAQWATVVSLAALGAV